MKKHNNKKQLGPLFQTGQPKFGYEEAQRENQDVEKATKGWKGEEHLLHKYLIHNNQQRFYGRGASSVKNIIQAIEDDKIEFLEDFNQVKGHLQIRVPENLKSFSNKNYDPKAASSRRIKAPQLLASIQLDNDSIINSINNSQLSKSQNYQQFTNKIFQLPKLKSSHNLIIGEKDKHSITENQILVDEESLIKSKLHAYTFTEGDNEGLQTNKKLKNYDCWGEEITPEQWIDKCKLRPNQTHAVCPTFLDGKYIWSDVKVIDYDKKSDKFHVLIEETQQYKWVVRLSLMFKEEDPDAFKERVELSKQRQSNAEDEVRFKQFVDSQPVTCISVLSQQLKDSILKKMNSPVKFNNKTDYNSPFRKELIIQILEEVSFDYLRFMKKCIVLKEMSDKSNEQKWIKYRIRNRYEKKVIPFYGTFVQLDYNYDEKREELSQRHISNQNLVVKTLNKINNRCYDNFKTLLFNTHLSQMDLPLTISEFESKQENFHDKEVRQTKNKVRELIISDIQDTLHNPQEKNFYVTEDSAYKDSSLQRLLIRIDLTFNTFMRDAIIKYNIKRYCDFIRNFIIPQEKDPDIWSVKPYPLIIFNLIVNKNFNDKKKQQNKDKKKKDKHKKDEKDEEDKEDDKQTEEAIFFEPSFQQVCNSILKPFDWLVKSCNSFFKLEKDLVPLIEMTFETSYHIVDEFKEVQESKEIIINFLQEGMQEQTTPIDTSDILEIFRKLSTLLEKQVKDQALEQNEQKELSKYKSQMVTFLQEGNPKILETLKRYTLLMEKSAVQDLRYCNEYKQIQEGKDIIIEYLKEGYQEPSEILEKFKKYNFLMDRSAKEISKQLYGSESETPLISNLDQYEVREKLETYKKAKNEIQRICLDVKDCIIFQVRTSQAKKNLMDKADEVIKSILDRTQEILQNNIDRIKQLYQEQQDIIKHPPENEISLVNLKNTIAENQVTLAKLGAEVSRVYEFLIIMEDYQFEINDNVQENYWDLKSQPVLIQEAILTGKDNAQKQEDRFTIKLDRERIEFEETLTDLQNNFEKIKLFENYDEKSKNNQECFALAEKIYNAVEKVKSFNQRESLFSQSHSVYPNLEQLETEFKPYKDLWEMSLQFKNQSQDWRTGSILQQNYQDIEKAVSKDYFIKTKGLLKKFQEKEDERAINLASKLEEDIKKFKETMWIIEYLTTPAMQNVKKSQGHWMEIYNAILFTEEDTEETRKKKLQEMELNDDLSLDKLLNNKFSDHRGIIEEVSKKAEKQWQIEKKLKDMEEKLKLAELKVFPYKKTGTFVLQQTDEISQLIDDQLNLLIMIKASPYAKGHIEKNVKILEQKMNWIQDTLDYWMKVQRGWMYLEPIFASDDIKKDLPQEKSRFDTIDFSWKQIMLKFSNEPNIWENIDSEKYKTDFMRDHASLEQIQQKLSKYLEKKRQYFPRFYFLSDGELLEILADTKDPQKVQKHINKCFEAIYQLDFKGEAEVIGMISAEKENVPFLKSINVNEGPRKGNVEVWLDDIQKMMVETLKDITRRAVLDTGTKRIDWVRKWVGQVVLAVNMTRWTQGSEIAITKGKIATDPNFKNLKEYFNFLENQLKEIVALVRTPLTALHREILGALIVLDVHAKDVIEDLEVKGTSSIQDFDWMQQLRYEWDESKKDHILWVQIINTALKYGFEYLGNTPRLVVTPLTDRCYRTLMGAYYLQYGGGPEGPAGTGKTETTKDLAKANAVMCVVFNCSDQLNYLAMRTFFKGLSSSGGWCCFDEFNRIDLEVLSVVAQQVDQIQQAIKNKKTSFHFDGEEDPIKLVLTCAINITMNPGYAGRSELPDNLKRLFRPCAMMVPEYSLIAEIYLYSVGYSDARALSKKITTSLRLSSEQLSSQYHYDFGMRGLKAILTAAGLLKRSMLNVQEDFVIMRALMDVNIPKFTTKDIPLFYGITGDLFPGIKLPDPDTAKLVESIKLICEKLNLVSSENFIQKCIQLFDTIAVRHGLMVVGQAFSGKSAVMETLRRAISNLKGVIDGYENVQALKLNPKSINADQLYGKLDQDTKQWTDGVISNLMRACTKDVENPEKKWIVFDGPVDAVWIENMNTVLDDNKKLCLSNGEIIKMTNQMVMMFEVDDLSQASPATVSRCGMVFLEAHQLGWDPLIISFCNQIPVAIQGHKDYIQTTLLWLINVALSWALKKGKFYVHNSDMIMVDNCLTILQTFFNSFLEVEGKDVKVPKDFEPMAGNMCLFSVVWGIGGTLEETSRKPFSDLVQKLITQAADIPQEFDIVNELKFPFFPRDIQAKLPEKTGFFNLVYQDLRNQWITWLQSEAKFTPPLGGDYTNLLIPTSDSIRNNYFVQRAMDHKFHLMICGPTGTGKTVNIINKISRMCKEDDSYTNCITSFSGQTTANQVQRLIEGKVNTRRRKGVFGPEEGKKFIAIFIDDLNMPKKEVYGAQPPIEILRQWMDNGGWYDLDSKEKEWKTLQGLTFISSMLPPTGGRNVISQRYQRHYNLLYVEPFEKDSLFHIFTNVLDWYFVKEQIGLAAITQLRDKTVEATIDLYKTIQSSPQLAPIPSKSHYTYNLRDISKVFQGMAKSNNKAFKKDTDFIKLWAHESSRVFKDRLINQQDQDFFDQMLKEMVDRYFKRSLDEIIEVKPLLWSHFIPTILKSDDDPTKKIPNIYCEITNREDLVKICYNMLNEYNEQYTANKMNLVLFETAIIHVIKIVRVITTTFGHALLVGVGGSGRKSLATLSTFIACDGSEPQIVNQKDWVEEIQRLLKLAGVENRETVFLFSDTQILKESMVEDICNLLNNGEIASLWNVEDKAKLLEEVDGSGLPNEKYQFFVKSCKDKLHIVLAFSPVGEEFRKRLITFPALVNCTTIDWFLPWPEDALRSTASNHYITNMGITDEKIVKGLVEVGVDMQVRVRDLTARMVQQLRRYYYVTPTSYLELLATFKKLNGERGKDFITMIERYRNGVKKIEETNEKVEVMQKELEQMQPELLKMQKENSIMMENLKKNEKDANIKKEACLKDEAECNITKEQALAIKTECDESLSKVLPILENAAKALEKITKDDINTLKSFSQPPSAAKIVMEGICYAFNCDNEVKWIPKPDGKPGEKMKDFWDYSKKKLLNDKLISKVKGFGADMISAIPDEKIKILKEFVANPAFAEDVVQKASTAAYQLSKWIRAVVQTYDALLIVEPKKKELAMAEAKLKAAEDLLAQKKAALQQVLDQLEKLNSEFKEAQAKEKELNDKYKLCLLRKGNAVDLIDGLQNEGKAWDGKANQNAESFKTVLGDCMLCSGIIAYLGAFPADYREEAINNWKRILQEQNILFNHKFKLEEILCDPNTVGQWTSRFKLPNDEFSINNAIIMKNSERFSLFIDPQGQANQFIKLMEPEIKITKPPITQKEYTETTNLLENAVQFGWSILLERVGETIDQIYDPILKRQIIKQGSKYFIKLADNKEVSYDPKFRLYITTKLPKPHYTPEICVMVTMLNFQVTPTGLQDQISNIIVSIEQSQLYNQREKGVQEYFQNKMILVQMENEILRLLKDSEGEILDNKLLIETLKKSNESGKDIQEKIQRQVKTNDLFNTARNQYNEVAKRVANLYFVIYDLAIIEPTYQYSLEWYLGLFQDAIAKSRDSKGSSRNANIIETTQLILYDNTCRALLEKDKLIFSFLLCIKILEIDHIITMKETRFLMIGGTATEAKLPQPVESKSWLSPKQWYTINEFSELLPCFKGFNTDFEKYQEVWKNLYNSPNPHELDFPEQWNNLLYFQKLIVIRTLYTDKFAKAVQVLIIKEMGEKYVQPPAFNIRESFALSNKTIPLIFILSPGADPKAEMDTMASLEGKGEQNFKVISLGQGQEIIATTTINQCMESGNWVLLQNCHLASSYMPILERILENLPDNLNNEFRIWLTTAPSSVFPSTILMKGVKMTYEPPRGIKSNLLRVFQSQPNDKAFERCGEKVSQWKKMFFGLSFFHASILERRKYGPLGWNIPYEFTIPDFTVSWNQLAIFLTDYPDVPYAALKYMVAQANYGGRVTDGMDRILVATILETFYTPQIHDENYKFSESGIYYSPSGTGSLNDFLDYIKQLPLNDPTEVFGLHSNAEITSNIIETNFICDTILQLLPRQTVDAGGQSPEQLVKEKLAKILKEIPKPFDPDYVQRKHPIKREESMNTVLNLEIQRFNKMVVVVSSTLRNVSKAIDGLLVMSSDLEMVYTAIQDNKVPALWHKVAYPSLKPLGSWIIDFLDRLGFIQKWIDNGVPAAFWFSGFHFTQSFLTGVLQNYARKYQYPIDQLNWEFSVINPELNIDTNVPPENGCYIYGLFLDGCKWNIQKMILDESDPKILFVQMPYIQLIPTKNVPDWKDNQKKYMCPVYRTSKRAGTLTTSGHSTNFVMHIYLDIGPAHTQQHWIKRGVAALSQLDD